MKYRFEHKYIINTLQMAVLKHRIESILPMDVHACPQGPYRIRSLYFDDRHNRCFYENEDGVSPREKYRLRLYNGSAEYIRLECKRKEKGMTAKTSCVCSRQQAQMFMDNAILPASTEAIVNRLLLLYHTDGMHPVIIVEYDRLAFVNAVGNVRITFDTNLFSSSFLTDFFQPELVHRRPVMPVGMHLMEVKYDHFLPDHIYQTLNLDELAVPTAFSKYYLCRKYALGKPAGQG